MMEYGLYDVMFLYVVWISLGMVWIIFASHDFCIMFSPYDFHYLSLYIYIYIVLNSKVCIFNLNEREREREREGEIRKVLFLDI